MGAQKSEIDELLQELRDLEVERDGAMGRRGPHIGPDGIRTLVPTTCVQQGGEWFTPYMHRVVFMGEDPFLDKMNAIRSRLGMPAQG